MQRCTHCGKEIQDNITLCPYCLNGAQGSHQNDLKKDWRPQEEGRGPTQKKDAPPRPAERPGLPLRTLGILAAVLVICMIGAVLITALLPHPVPESPDRAIVEEVLLKYHAVHPSNNTSLDDTGRESIELVGLLNLQGITARVQAGTLDAQVSDRDGVNRAWVLAAVNNSTKSADGAIVNTTTWLAGDPASGTVIPYDQNRYYYTGLIFNNTSAFQDFLDAKQDYLTAQVEYTQASAAYQDLQQQSKSTSDYQQKVKLDYQIYTQAAVVSQKEEWINQTYNRFWSVPVQ